MNAQIESVTALEGHTEKAWSVAWNPRYPILASCSTDQTIRLASYMPNYTGYNFNHTSTLKSGHNKTIRSVDWKRDGKVLASASFDSTVGIWEWVKESGIEDSGEGALTDELDFKAEDGDWDCTATLEGHESEIKAVRWSSGGDLLATCGRDKAVWIWEALPGSDFECLAVLMDHTQDVKSLAWHPKEEILASASYDDTVRLYRTDTGTDEWVQTHVLPKPEDAADGDEGSTKRAQGHDSTVWSCAFSPDGAYLASSSADRTIRIWWRRVLPKESLPDIRTVYRVGASEKERWECIDVLEGYHLREIYSVDWTCDPDRRSSNLGWLASTGSDGRICVFDIKRGDAPGRVSHTLLAMVESAHGVSDVNCVAWCKLRSPRNREEDDVDMDVDEDDLYDSTQRLLASAGDDCTVRIWRVTMPG